jgi:flagellar protein FlaF
MKLVQDNWEADRSDLDGALLYNRKLWTILSVAATDAESELPIDIKKNMALLAIFIFNRSLDLISEPKKADLDALIAINQNIAIGLMTKPGEGAAALSPIP